MDEKVARVVAAGAERGLTIDPVTFQADTRTSQQAADAVGCEVGQIVKSLVFDGGDQMVLFLVSGSNRVDPEKGAAAAGIRKLKRADPERARAATGYSIGATPPLGHTNELAVFMDEDLLRYDEVWAAAGRPDSVFRCDPKELARAARATVADLKET
jgi:Cys-tRNA(Pro) deacylase